MRYKVGCVRGSKMLGVVIVVASVLLAAGCTGGDKKQGGSPGVDANASASAAASSSSAAATATGDLRAAVTELTKTSYRYTLKAGDATGGGTVDPTAAQSSLSISVAAEGEAFKTDVLILGPELFAKISGLPLPGLDGKKWFRIDRSRIKSFNALGIRDVDDPTGVKTLSGTIATIQKTGDRSYKGTLDLSKGSAAFGLDDAAAKQLGEKARAVPFEATVNEQGRLATWKMTIPAHGSEKETSFELAYTEHGGKFELKKPAAGEVVNPPEAVYEMLQS
jgi:hypothetical protein